MQNLINAARQELVPYSAMLTRRNADGSPALHISDYLASIELHLHKIYEELIPFGKSIHSDPNLSKDAKDTILKTYHEIRSFYPTMISIHSATDNFQKKIEDVQQQMAEGRWNGDPAATKRAWDLEGNQICYSARALNDNIIRVLGVLSGLLDLMDGGRRRQRDEEATSQKPTIHNPIQQDTQMLDPDFSLLQTPQDWALAKLNNFEKVFRLPSAQMLDQRAVKKKYYQLALFYHPDKNHGFSSYQIQKRADIFRDLSRAWTRVQEIYEAMNS
jgi:hypothetical protein